MNLLAIVGSPRKRRATDTLVDRAVEGYRSRQPECGVAKIHLADHDIRPCRNCLACRDADTSEPLSPCVIKDDMAGIYERILEADALVFGTPVHSGCPTALMMILLERITWTFARPVKSYPTVRGCPAPRSAKKRKSAIIVTSGIIPPHFRMFCDGATKCIRGIARDSLNSKTIGSLYAGDIEHRGVDRYLEKAEKLGRRLAG